MTQDVGGFPVSPRLPIKGRYPSLVALQAEFPNANVGDCAIVDPGTGVGAQFYLWDANEGWRNVGLSAIPTMTMLGNNTGESAVPTALTKTDVQTLLDIGWVLQSRATTGTNASVPVHSLTATGTETDIDIVLSPKGVGAVLANTPNGAASGGNKRGQNAVDLQTKRAAATEVASGLQSVISGGEQNKATGQYSVVAGGFNNDATNSSAICLGGNNNTSSGIYAITGGASNTASGSITICLGDGNSAASNYGIAIGRANASGAQYAAILSGYTNQSSGLYAVVAGGYDNTANGQSSAVCGGDSNSANGNYAGVLSGYMNTANGAQSAVLGGSSNQASGVGAAVVGGVGNIAAADYSVALGYSAHTQLRKRTVVESAGAITTAGDVQVCRSVLRGQTTDATSLRLAVDGDAISAGNTFSSMTYQLLHIKGRCIARAPGTLGDYAIWEFTALMNQNADNASVTLLAAVSPTLVSSGGTGNTWTLAVTADTSFGSLNVTATGEAAKTITWGCALDVLEVRDIA